MRILYLVIFGMSALSAAHGGELYTITDLGPGNPIALNNQGAVLAQGLQGAFLYQGGETQYLPQPQGGTFAARAINDLGEVVGTTNFGSGFQYYLTTYVNGALTVNTALPDLYPVAINNAGQITGVQVSKYDSFLYSGGTLTTIPNQLNVVEPLSRAMNSSGAITDVFYPSPPVSQQSFLFSNGQFTPLATPGTFSIVGGINDSGVIAGSYGLIPGSLLSAGVFVYDAGGFHSLGPAAGGIPAEEDGVAGINNAGVIVGGSETSTSPYLVGWVYFPGTGFMNLNDLISPNSGWNLHGAAGINNAGQIVGDGMVNGRDDMFLLTPVPEPGTALLFVSAILALSVHRSTRRVSAAAETRAS